MYVKMHSAALGYSFCLYVMFTFVHNNDKIYVR